MKKFLTIFFAILALYVNAQEATVPEWEIKYNELIDNSPYNTDREKAIDIIKQAIAIIDTTTEKGVNYYFAGSGEMMIQYIRLEKYKEAERVFNSALSFYTDTRQQYEGFHRLLAAAGILYVELRDDDKALDILKKGKVLCEMYLNKSSVYAGILASMSEIYMRKKDRIHTKLYADMAKEITMKDENASKDQRIAALLNITTTYTSLEYREEAIKTLKEIKKIAENDKKMHYFLPYIYNNIAINTIDTGNYSDGLPYIVKAYEYSKLYGYSNWPLLYFNLVYSYFLVGQTEHSYKYALEMAEYLKNDAVNKFSYLDSNGREQYWKQNNMMLVFANSIIYKTNTDSSEAKVYDNTLFSKGLLLRTANHIKNAISKSENNDLKQAFNLLTSYRSKLADNTIPKDSIPSVKMAISYIEKYLMENVKDYNELNIFMNHTWTDIQNSLTSQEIAIEFIPFFNVTRNNETLNPHFAAAIIKKEYDTPKIIPLCSTQTLLSILVDETDKRTNESVDSLYIGQRGEKLYQAIWKPIEDEMKGVKTIYYSPVGLIYTISLNAINDGINFLSEKYDVRLVSSTSEIIDMKKEKQYIPENAVVYGGINYDTEDANLIANAEKHSRRENLTRGEWGFLPGSKKEAENIYNILDSAHIQSTILENNEANEESFKKLSNNVTSIIHIATHGFLIESSEDIISNKYVLKKYKENQDIINNPMQLTGLLFAGANRAWRDENIISNHYCPVKVDKSVFEIIEI